MKSGVFKYFFIIHELKELEKRIIFTVKQFSNIKNHLYIVRCLYTEKGSFIHGTNNMFETMQ